MNPRAARGLHAWLVVSFGALLCAFFASTLQRGLWEDGYFVKRFAYNFWHHGSFAWNPSDGALYGMTSQTLQLLATLLYAIDAQHVVVLLKASLCLALFATLLLIRRIAEDAERPASSLLPAAVALSLPLVIEVITSGLETVLAMCVVALAVRLALRFDRARSASWSQAWPLAAAIGLVYLTRPDAILIPIVLVALLAWPDLRHLRVLAVLVGAGIGLLLLGFYAYYGTAFPLSFYVKVRVFDSQPTTLAAIYAGEKIKNASKIVLFALPFVYVALHERSKRSVALLLSGLAFATYHLFLTVEAMGQLSRFYLPALVPVASAAVLSYEAFLRTRHTARNLAVVALYLIVFVVADRVLADLSVDIVLEGWRFLPFAVACGVMLLAPRERPLLSGALVGAALWASALFCYPVHTLHVDDDMTILLRQIAPRLVFRDLATLRERLDVHTLFHTDMGAPGLLFPEARVVDLDGLLNKDITLRHIRFEALCRADHPDAIFVPKKAYKELQLEVLASACIADYRPVRAEAKAPLRIRADLVPRWHAHD